MTDQEKQNKKRLLTIIFGVIVCVFGLIIGTFMGSIIASILLVTLFVVSGPLLMGGFIYVMVKGMSANKQLNKHVECNLYLLKSKLGVDTTYTNNMIRKGRDYYDILDTRDPSIWKDPIREVVRIHTITTTNNNELLDIERLATRHGVRGQSNSRDNIILDTIFDGTYITNLNTIDKHINLHIRTDDMAPADHNIPAPKKGFFKQNEPIEDKGSVFINDKTFKAETIKDSFGYNATVLLGNYTIEPETLIEIATLLNGLSRSYTGKYDTPACSIYAYDGNIHLALKGLTYFEFGTTKEGPKDKCEVNAKHDIVADLDILVSCIDVMNQIIELLTY